MGWVVEGEILEAELREVGGEELYSGKIAGIDIYIAMDIDTDIVLIFLDRRGY